MNKACFAVALLLAVAVSRSAAQEVPADDRLWMPQGYELLSIEQRQRLSPEEMKRVGTRNQELLDEAIAAMSAQECQELAARLAEFGRTHELKNTERQYLTQVTMRLVARPSVDEQRKRLTERRDRLDRLIREQEETTRGFPSEREPVVREADEIESRIGQGDPTELYLRALKPLRARPWNEEMRVAFRKVVRGRSELIDAALAFCAARQNETPQEGAWYSLEAFLRLSMKDEVDAARKLFDVAIRKNSNDVESRIFPLLLAEIDGDSAAVARLRPRALEAWPDPARLDEVLFESVGVLPPALQARAHDTFEARYAKSHPTDWESRLRRIWNSLRDDPHDARRQERLPELEREADAVVVLPAAVLPQEYRMQFRAVGLIVRARLGRCDEAVAALPVFEREVTVAAPRLPSWNGPPVPKTVRDVQVLRKSFAGFDAWQKRIEAYRKSGQLSDMPELQDVPVSERAGAVEEALEELDAARKEADAILALDADDAAIAAAWSRQERSNWEHEQRLDTVLQYDASTSADLYRIRVRSAIGRCLLDRKDVEHAIAVLQPCLGDRRNLHRDCVNPLLDAGVLLANAGHPKDSLRIYRLVEPLMLEDGGHLAALRYAIERAEPGSLPPPLTPKPGPERTPVP